MGIKYTFEYKPNPSMSISLSTITSNRLSPTFALAFTISPPQSLNFKDTLKYIAYEVLLSLLMWIMGKLLSLVMRIMSRLLFKIYLLKLCKK